MPPKNYYLYLAARPSCYVQKFDAINNSVKFTSIENVKYIIANCGMTEQMAKEYKHGLELFLGIKTVITQLPE